MRTLTGLAAALLLLAAPAPASAQDFWLVVIEGLAGDPERRGQFHQWSSQLVDAAEARFGAAPERIVYLAPDPAADPARIDAEATRSEVEARLAGVAERAGAGDHVMIVLLGHGSFANGEARFNLKGPDLTADDFDRLLDGFAGQRVTFVNTASSSGAFLAPLSGPNRTIVTATRTGGERNETVFPRFFVEALTSAQADLDKNQRISVLEAFEYARRRVVESYETEGLLLTEHPVLDDNGDGEGSDAFGADAADGGLARALFMDAGARRAHETETDDPELLALYERRRELEAKVEALRTSRDSMDPQEYQRALEALLLEVAETGRQIRQREGQP